MEEIKHTYYTGNGWGNCGGYNYGGCGFGGLGIGLGLLALGGLGLGVAALMKRDDGCEKYIAAKSQGATEAAIACNGAAIARVENALSQMTQNQFFGSTVAAATNAIINAGSVNQQKNDAGFVANSVQLGSIIDILKSVSTPNSIYSVERTTPTAA